MGLTGGEGRESEGEGHTRLRSRRGWGRSPLPKRAVVRPSDPPAGGGPGLAQRRWTRAAPAPPPTHPISRPGAPPPRRRERALTQPDSASRLCARQTRPDHRDPQPGQGATIGLQTKKNKTEGQNLRNPRHLGDRGRPNRDVSGSSLGPCRGGEEGLTLSRYPKGERRVSLRPDPRCRLFLRINRKF